MTEVEKIRRLMQGVIPYLSLDEPDTAIAFYKKAFGAVQHGETVRAPNGLVGNAGIEINGGMVMLESMFKAVDGMPARGGQGFTMQLVVEDGDLWWNRAVAAGCEVTSPFERQFWGDRYGRLRDPFGVDWAINEPAPEKL